MIKLFTILFLLSCANLVVSQDALVAAELRLEKKLNALRACKNDDEYSVLNKDFKQELEATFKIDGFFNYPFSKLTTMGSIKSSDNLVRLFNWNIEYLDQTQIYFCYVAYSNNNKITVTELIDNSFILPARPIETLEHNNWYGALYYQIIPVNKKNKKLYTVVGWDGNSSFSDIKVIDVIYFTGTKPKIGYPIFKDNDGVHRRVFFEFKKNCVMSLRYEQERKMIIYDHLSPESPSLVGVYAFYVPDMSYDAFDWDGTHWKHKADVVAVNPMDKRKKTVVRDGDGKTIKVIENEWIDPSNGGSPIDNGKHVAVTPEDENKRVKNPKKITTVQPTHPNYRKGKKKNKPGSAIKI